MQRLSNNHILSTCCKPLNEWVRDGDDFRNRLKILRDLSDPDGEGEMEFLVVQALVQMSKGRKTIIPFGTGASNSTKQFKEVPSPWFGLALAGMYKFVKLDQDRWLGHLRNSSKKGCSHPMTQMWHVNDVNK